MQRIPESFVNTVVSQDRFKQWETEWTLIYREEPFIYDCDSISFQVYLMIVRKGVWKQKIMVEKM